MFFTELLPYQITPRDRAFSLNNRTLLDFLKKIKEAKLEDIRQGKECVDLVSILLKEGTDVYAPLGVDAERALLDDIKMIYFAASNTTHITINNVLKYIHMDCYKHVRAKLISEIDELVPVTVWDPQGKPINSDRLLDACSYENVMENFDYTMMCFRESMRIEPVVGFSTAHTVTRDVVLCRGTPK